MFFFLENILIPNVAEKNILILVEGKKKSLSHFRWLFLSNSSEGDPVGIFKCGSRKEKYLGSVTI
jgi:hypothetical protein